MSMVVSEGPPAVVDPAVILQLSAEQRVVNGLRALGLDQDQVRALTREGGAIQRMISRVKVCDHGSLGGRCACYRLQIRAEVEHQIPVGTCRLTHDEIVDIVLGLGRDHKIPDQLMPFLGIAPAGAGAPN